MMIFDTDLIDKTFNVASPQLVFHQLVEKMICYMDNYKFYTNLDITNEEYNFLNTLYNGVSGWKLCSTELRKYNSNARFNIKNICDKFEVYLEWN